MKGERKGMKVGSKKKQENRERGVKKKYRRGEKREGIGSHN